MEKIMSNYQYAWMSFNTARQAARASVSDYLYAGGNNNTEYVANMNIAEMVCELQGLISRNEWTIEDCNMTIEELVREVVCEAGEESQQR
jgi:hypothetical protein